MAIALPVLTAANASAVLTRKFLDLETSNPAPVGSPAGLIVAMPTVWANKYQLLLYGAAAAHHQAVVGVSTPADLAHISWPGPVVLHAHWFAPIFRTAQSEAEATARLAIAQDQILRFRDRTGAKLLWSAHNVVPHGNAFPETFQTLRRWVFEQFDALHVMQDAHIPLLETAFGHKAPPHFTAPHMTYDGTLLDSVSPAAARAHFGVPQEACVFGFFGSVQGYKKIDLMLEAVDRLAAQTERPVAAIVGGIPGADTEVVRDLHHRWGDSTHVRLLTRKIADHEIQYIHRAADAMVLPYDETLNSGAALMAASFRKPFILPEGPIAQSLQGAGAIPFDATQPSDLYAKMAACLDGVAPLFDAQVLKKLTPERVSQQFFQGLVDHGLIRV